MYDKVYHLIHKSTNFSHTYPHLALCASSHVRTTILLTATSLIISQGRCCYSWILEIYFTRHISQI